MLSYRINLHDNQTGYLNRSDYLLSATKSKLNSDMLSGKWWLHPLYCFSAIPLRWLIRDGLEKHRYTSHSLCSSAYQRFEITSDHVNWWPLVLVDRAAVSCPCEWPFVWIGSNQIQTHFVVFGWIDTCQNGLTFHAMIIFSAKFFFQLNLRLVTDHEKTTRQTGTDKDA